jgi:hypothetical protein
VAFESYGHALRGLLKPELFASLVELTALAIEIIFFLLKLLLLLLKLFFFRGALCKSRRRQSHAKDTNEPDLVQRVNIHVI